MGLLLRVNIEAVEERIQLPGCPAPEPNLNHQEDSLERRKDCNKTNKR